MPDCLVQKIDFEKKSFYDIIMSSVDVQQLTMNNMLFIFLYLLSASLQKEITIRR